MKQIVAIFSKDARRFWPEIFVSIAVLAALVLVYPHQWRVTNQTGMLFETRHSFFTRNPLEFFSECLVVLVPVGWWIMIARLVHGERLVGNTQFWLTRPYEWQKFLAAKLMFLAAFISIPFFVAQCAMLLAGGFNPLSVLPGLFYNLLLATGIIVLPLVMLSAVTSGFGRMTLVMLSVILFIAGMALLSSILPSDTVGGVASPLADKASFGILLCGCSAAVVVQYARRKLKTAWLLIVGIGFSLAALAFIDPDDALMGRYYPSPTALTAAPAAIAYAPTPSLQPVTFSTQDKNELEISIPLRAAGVATDHVVIPVAVKAVIEAPDRARWESPWNVIYNVRYLPGSSDSAVRFRIRRSVYDRFKPAPANLRLIFAIDEARAATVTNVPLTSSEFTVPGVGICMPQSTWFSLPPEVTGINCRSAMRRPQLTYITAQWTEDPCSERGAKGENILGTGWVGSFDTDAAEFGITSVWETPLVLSNSWAGYDQGRNRSRQLCPGSPVTFTRYQLTGHTQIAITIPNFRLPELALGDTYRLLLR